MCTFAILTFGCRVNQGDSFDIVARLQRRGAVPAAPDTADIVIVNTCAVTAAGEQAARQAIRRIARRNPGVRIVATGCSATRDAAAAARLPNVVRVVTNDDKARIAELLEERAGGISTAEQIPPAPGTLGRTVFPLTVQTGCSEACTYCVVPTTRGRPRSRPIEEIVPKVKRAADAGFHEVLLAGVHLGSWGRDLEPARSFSDLVSALADVRCGVRFRVSSVEPMDLTDALLDAWIAAPCFAPHFHLPWQHGSNRVLSAMRRPYTSQFYMDLVGRIRARLPHAAIGADLIAGFPGESSAEAHETENLLASSPLSHVHVFPYSDRPGTVASAMRPKLAGTTIRSRARAWREIGAGLTRRFRQQQIGTTRPGLTLEGGTLVLTDNYLKVRIPPGHRRNEWVNVKLVADGEVMRGEVVEDAGRLGPAFPES